MYGRTEYFQCVVCDCSIRSRKFVMCGLNTYHVHCFQAKAARFGFNWEELIRSGTFRLIGAA